MAIKFSEQQAEPAKKSTAPRRDAVRVGSDEGTLSRTAPRREHVLSRIEPKVAETCNRVEPSEVSGNVTAGTQALPVDTKPTFDRNEYQREYMRDKATIKRLGLSISVAEYRKGKGEVK